MIGRDTSQPKRKKMITCHLTHAVGTAEKIKKKYRQKRTGTKKLPNGSKIKVSYMIMSLLKKLMLVKVLISKKTSGAPTIAKNIVKKYCNLARK